MAAFSSSFVDSIFLPNNPSTINKMCGLFCEPNNAQIYKNLDQSTNVSAHIINDAPSVLSITKNTTIDRNSSSIITHHGSEKITQKVTPMFKKRKCREMREVKGKKQKIKEGEEKKKFNKEDKKAIIEEAPKGYIHVRARRGQATDSHSLAERVRRERISERMKLLQSIVPGCDKVTGKALMLDEIINYIQSLQNQVEFLSLKLASMNPMLYDFGMDLGTFMVGPNQTLSSLPISPLPAMQECSPTTSATTNNYNNSLLDNNSAYSFMFHEQSQIPNSLPQGNRQILWEMEDQKQKIINNETGFSDNLFSFTLI